MLPYPRKRFGQHFLLDKNIIAKIINYGNYQKNDLVLEIGPGRGSLTNELYKIVNNLYAVEYDRDLVIFLKQKYPRLQLFEEDALEFNFALPQKQFEKEYQKISKIKLIGNLPYNIASQLLFRFIENIKKFDQLIIMVQKEVADRITAKTSTKEYSRLTVSSQYFFDITRLIDVKASAFYPSPKVNSSVLQLLPKPQQQISQCDWKQLLDVIKIAFANRRKKISNNFKKHLSAKQLDVIGKKNNIFDLADLRAENLPLKVYIEITKMIYKK